MINDERCARDSKSRNAMAQAAFNKKSFFTSKLYLNLRKKLIQLNIWCTALYGAETWTFQKVDQKYLEGFEMWCWRRIDRSLTCCVKYEVFESRQKETSCIQY